MLLLATCVTYRSRAPMGFAGNEDRRPTNPFSPLPCPSVIAAFTTGRTSLSRTASQPRADIRREPLVRRTVTIGTRRKEEKWSIKCRNNSNRRVVSRVKWEVARAYGGSKNRGEEEKNGKLAAIHRLDCEDLPCRFAATFASTPSAGHTFACDISPLC